MFTRWNVVGLTDLDRSFAALTDLRDEMDRVFRRFENEWTDFPPVIGGTGSAASPRVLVQDAGEEFHVTADVPGFKPDDLHISLEQGTLTIRGERADEILKGYSVHRKERNAISFARSFALPARVEADKVEAKLDNGVLELRLPKVAEARPRTITVKAS